MAYQIYTEGYEDDYWTEEAPHGGAQHRGEERIVDYWPLLDIREALLDCERTLAEIVDGVETLVAEGDAQYPPDAAHLLRTLAAMRAHLADMLTPALHLAIAREQAQYEADLARWAALPP